MGNKNPVDLVPPKKTSWLIIRSFKRVVIEAHSKNAFKNFSRPFCMYSKATNKEMI